MHWTEYLTEKKNIGMKIWNGQKLVTTELIRGFALGLIVANDPRTHAFAVAFNEEIELERTKIGKAYQEYQIEQYAKMQKG